MFYPRAALQQTMISSNSNQALFRVHSIITTKAEALPPSNTLRYHLTLSIFMIHCWGERYTQVVGYTINSIMYLYINSYIYVCVRACVCECLCVCNYV